MLDFNEMQKKLSAVAEAEGVKLDEGNVEVIQPLKRIKFDKKITLQDENKKHEQQVLSALKWFYRIWDYKNEFGLSWHQFAHQTSLYYFVHINHQKVDVEDNNQLRMIIEGKGGSL